MDTKDIIRTKQLGCGFIIFQNKDGYFVGFLGNGTLEVAYQIDRVAYNTIEKSQGGRKNGKDR